MLSLTPRTNFGLNFFDDIFSHPFFRGSESMQMPSMKTDVREKDGMYLLDIDLPGFDKNDIKAELNNGYLTISAEVPLPIHLTKKKATSAVKDIQVSAAEAFM